jgi:hypothetical protein
MTREQALVEAARAFRGWRSLGDRRSNGDTMCIGCWDRSEHDTDADHDIPPGELIWWNNPHPEYGETDPYCTACVLDDAECNEIITAADAERLCAALSQYENKETDNG